MNDGILVLSFSEVVDVDTLQVNEFVLQNNINGAAALTYPLSHVSFGQSNDKTVYINILQSDIFMLQLIDGLASDEFNTYLYFSSSAVSDTNGNSIVPISSNMARKISVFTNDITPPVLISLLLTWRKALLT